MPDPRHEYPRLRPVEAIPGVLSNGAVALRDPSGLAAGMLAVPAQILSLLALMDGRHRRLEIQAAFARQFGEILLSDELDGLLDQLDRAGYLEGEGFERYYSGLLEEYRAAPHRPLRGRDALGAPDAEMGAYLDRMLEAASPAPAADLVGLVAPHLDYGRGEPCYAAAYALLREGPRPSRVVLLGTNHFGRSRAVVATAKPFETPFGVVPNDVDFLDRLGTACGGDLMPSELDHAREHSVELQVVWLHHLLGDGFRIVPFLCPDPCGPTADLDPPGVGGPSAGGAPPADDHDRSSHEVSVSSQGGTRERSEGVDLRHFAETLGRLVRDDPEPTLLVAGADLSHVGTYFGDRRSLTPDYLAAIGAGDEAALAHVDANAAEAYLAHMTETGNPTRVCSVGCIYALMTALGPEARATRLGYHQAVTREIDNAVTCAAYAFHR